MIHDEWLEAINSRDFKASTVPGTPRGDVLAAITRRLVEASSKEAIHLRDAHDELLDGYDGAGNDGDRRAYQHILKAKAVAREMMEILQIHEVEFKAKALEEGSEEISTLVASFMTDDSAPAFMKVNKWFEKRGPVPLRLAYNGKIYPQFTVKKVTVS